MYKRDHYSHNEMHSFFQTTKPNVNIVHQMNYVKPNQFRSVMSINPISEIVIFQQTCDSGFCRKEFKS